MATYNIAKVSEDVLAQCDNEQIQTPESIQPFGGLLVIDADLHRIIRASQNIHEFLRVPVDRILNLTLTELLGSELAGPELLVDAADQSPCMSKLAEILASYDHHRYEVELTGVFKDLICEVHRVRLDDHGTCLVIEVEHMSSSQDRFEQWQSHVKCLRRITESATANKGLISVFAEVANSIQSMTEYDRVMIYQMDADGNGSVVAESKRPHLEEFVGMHFPASDIPKQARELYLLNRVRLLSDIRYQSVPVVSRTTDRPIRPLDMSMCYLRSISPVHIEYLQNMGVRATLVISIVIDNKLWGLVSCHHYQAKHIDAKLRNLCDGLAHIVSFAIQAEEQREMRNAIESSQYLHEELECHVGREVDWFRRLLEHSTNMLDQLGCSGMVICDDTRKVGVGIVPDDTAVDQIRESLKSQVQYSQSVVSTRSLLHNCPETIQLSSDVCGCCINIISQQPPLEILWFRKECTHAIQWSGDPRKLVTQGPEGPRLSPRKSFEKWCQVVQWHSAPWTLHDTFRIKAIGNFISSRKVEDASRLKSQFLANMSHEIRTPMTAITGYIDVLHENSPDLMRSPIHAEAIQSIRRNCQHLLQVINDILDFSKIEAGKMTIQPSLCSPSEIVCEVENALRAVAEAKRLRFEVLSNNLIPKQILIDPTRLKQILINLIGNAIKFTNSGTVSVELIYKRSSPEWMEFLVRDTGPGIHPGDQDVLFRPFVQGDNSMTRKQGGTGLGLNISRQLARLMGGDVDLRSSILDVGTTLGIKLPVGVRLPTQLVALHREDPTTQQNSSSEPESASHVENALPLNGMRVLLAEDGTDNQRLISFFIKKAGANIVIVENGLLALEALESEIKGGSPFDVVLMDMQMPVLDGYESSRLIRNLGHLTPIIALTAHAMTGDREKCIEAGCSHYLTKPLDRKKLISTVLECVKAFSRATR